MSSVPPNVPPGGGAPPPYDPRTQWRLYREQQKAAWRAQRNAWKAQRNAWKAQHHAWRAGYMGAYGPRVPSVVGPIILIGIGVVGLLVLTGHIAAGAFWSWYGRWWPVLLIAAGLALLGEWALDMRRKTPVRRSGSFVGILILLALLGFAAAGWNNDWGSLRGQFNNNDFFKFFGLPEHDFDQQTLSAAIPANAAIEIQNPRGDVSIASGEGSNIVVQAHEVGFAGSDNEAKKIFDAEAARLTVNGGNVLVKSESNDRGRVDLTITVPKTAKMTVNAGRGDVAVSGLGSGINISAAHGDTQLNSIAGPVEVHFSNNRHDFSAHQVEGDLTADGNYGDLTLSEIKGKINANGEIFGDVHMENITGPISLHTSVTDLQVASLPGDINLDSNNLRVTEAKGTVRVVTHAKDVDLSQIYGDCSVEDRNGMISVEPAGGYGVEAKNGRGDVEVTVPENASATVDGRTHNGDIVSDFNLTVSGDENKTVTGNIGSGGPKLVLSAKNGDIHIKKGPALPAQPPAPAAQTAPHLLHLKPSGTQPLQPVTQ